MDVRELALWLAQIKREDQKWDLRFLGLCVAIKRAAAGMEFDAAVFYPALFEGEASARAGGRAGGISVTDPAEMEAVLKAWAASASGKQPT